MIAPSDYNIFKRSLEEAPTSTSTFAYIYDSDTDTSSTTNEPLTNSCTIFFYTSLADEIEEFLFEFSKPIPHGFKNKPAHNRNHVPNRFCKNKDIKRPLLLNRKTLRCNRKGIGLRIRKGQ